MIILSNGFVIKADSKNFTLCKYRLIEKGENAGAEIEDNIAYCGTLLQAFERYLRELERQEVQSDDVDVKQAINLLKTVYERFNLELIKLEGKL